MAARPKEKSLGMTGRIVLALGLGVLVGITFGEYTAWMQVLGKVYVGLLQMTVLPYITVSLIASIGRRTWANGRRLLVTGAVVMVVLWILALGVLFFAPLALPPWETGSFFKASMLESAPPVNFLELFLPLNVFASLAQNVVPAVVVFCLAVGIALIGMSRKDRLLDLLDTVSEALMRVNKGVVRLTPYGVFAISAGVASTMTLEEISRIEGYVLVYTVLVLYGGLVFLPALVSTLTPFRYGEILRASKDAMITAFVTGKVLIVLPLLIESTKALFATLEEQRDETPRTIEALYPLAYPFPGLGKVLTIYFIPFAAWFSGQALSAVVYPRVLVVGLFSMFGGPVAAIPFLLDVQNLPNDLFQLFIATAVWTARVGDILSAMHLVSMAVLTTCAMNKLLQIRWGALLRLLLLSSGVLAACLVGIRSYLAGRLEDAPDPAALIGAMVPVTVAQGLVPDTSVLVAPTPNPAPLRDGEGVLERILRRQVLRVGYGEDRKPFTYRDAGGNLIGFDIDVANRLAIDLSVALELVPIDMQRIEHHLKADHVDIVLSGVRGTAYLARTVGFSNAYLDLHLAFLVPDTDVKRWQTPESMRAQGQPVIGVFERSTFENVLPRFVPGARFVQLEGPRAFFDGEHRDVDALLGGAEPLSFWTLAYPRYRVVRPEGLDVTIPLVIPYLPGQERLDELLDHWVDLTAQNGTFQLYYDHWMLGASAVQKRPRWSLIRNVFGWVD